VGVNPPDRVPADEIRAERRCGCDTRAAKRRELTRRSGPPRTCESRLAHRDVRALVTRWSAAARSGGRAHQPASKASRTCCTPCGMPRS